MSPSFSQQPARLTMLSERQQPQSINLFTVLLHSAGGQLAVLSLFSIFGSMFLYMLVGAMLRRFRAWVKATSLVLQLFNISIARELAVVS